MNKWWFPVVVVCVALVVGSGEGLDFEERELESEERLWELYERWRSHHRVSTSLEEKQRRFNVFKANVQYVHNFNKKDKPYKLKLNKFADMTTHEFKSLYASSKIKHHRMLQGASRASPSFNYANVTDIPPSVDWRAKGAVTDVKDQGQCGKIDI